MKHFLPAIFFFLFSVSGLIAQVPSKDAQWLAPACKPKTYGLHNSKGEVAAEAKFDMLEEGDGKGWIAFSGGRYGVINSSGNWIIKPNFEIIVQFLNGKAVAGKKNKTKRTPRTETSPYYYEELYSLDNYDSTMYYGIVDASGVWVTEPVHDFIRLCDDGSAQYADANNKLGFINSDGSIMLRAQYDFASRMNDGVAVIGEIDPTASQLSRYNRNRFTVGKYFVIDRTGNKLNPEAYEMIREYKDGRAAFNKGGIWKKGRYGSGLKLIGGKWGYLDVNGKEIIAPAYDYVYDFADGKAKVRSGQRTFWVDKDGKETEPPLPVKNEKEFSIFCAPGFYGYIGLDGKFVIEPQYFVAKEFSEGLAAVMPLRASDMDCNNVPEANSDAYEISHRSYSRMMGRLLGLDTDYGIVFDSEEDAKMMVDSIRAADSLMALAMRVRRLYGYADKTGNMVLPAKYEVALPFHNGRAYVLFREKWGVIDTKGNWVFAPVLEWPDELSFINFDYGGDGRQYYNYGFGDMSEIFSFNEGVGCIYKYGQYGFIDSTGKVIVAPVYDEVKPFVNGMAAVRHGRYWGYIDKTGKEIISPAYKSAGSFTAEGLACVGMSPKNTPGREGEMEMVYEDDGTLYYGYIDKKGNWAIKPKFTEAHDFSNGLATVSVNYEKSGYIDKTGKFVIPPKYDYAGDFAYGYALVRINMYDAVYIDKTGKVSKTVTYDHPPQDKTIPLRPRAGANNYFGFVNDKGEEVIPYEFSEAGSFSKVK